MLKKELFACLVIILIIFSLGFIIRMESTHISGVPDDEKSFYKDPQGLPYMYDMDSYYNYRLTENFLNHGYLGDTKIKGREWDLNSYYPPGVPLDYPPLIVYLTAFLYKFVNLFNPVSLLFICFWVPIFISPFAGVVTFLFLRRFTNNYGAAAAGVLAVTAPFYFMRTVPGFFDTDMFNIIFPILVVWFFLQAQDSEKTNNKIFFAFLSAFAMFLFSLAWNGWQYLFYMMLIACILWMALCKLKRWEIKNFFNLFLIFFTFSILLVGINDYLNILKLILGPFELIKLFGSQGPWAPWPNVYILVSELQPPSLADLIGGLGPALFGLGLFAWGIFGISMLALVLKKNYLRTISTNLNGFFYILLLIWTIMGFLALSQGIRFILILIPPLTIITGILVGRGTETLDSLPHKNLKRALPLFMVILISIPSLLVIYGNIYHLTPRMNDDMWDAGIWINNNTQKDTLVLSSWVYGHFFTAVGHRPAVFDGRLGYIETLPVREYDQAYPFKDKSPGTAREYWMDRALATGNESLSAGIFRMISTSGDNGFLTLDEYTRNTSQSVEILNNILGVDKQTAYNITTEKYGLTDEEARSLLKYTHPEQSSSAVLVTYKGMIDYGYWIFNFGEWNFDRMEGGNFVYSFGTIKKVNNSLSTDDGIVMNLESGNATWNNRMPFAVITIKDNEIKKLYLDENSDFCIILLMDDHRSVVIDKRFENSLFTKLVLEESNQTTFKPLYHNKNVIVWEIAG